MSTALALAASAYRQANMDQILTSFTMTDFPYNIALDIFNTVIREMNRQGHYWFTETTALLTYSPGVGSYVCNTLGIDPKAILRIRKEATAGQPELIELNYRDFQRRYPTANIVAGEPTYYSKFGGVLYLNTIPDADYTLKVYYFRDMPLIAASTDTLLCQTSDEDVFQEGVYAYLLNRLGRPDWQGAYQSYIKKVNDLLASVHSDVGMANQMPASF